MLFAITFLLLLIINFIFPTIILASSCPVAAPFTDEPSIGTHLLTYPATVKSNNGSWLMFTGGIVYPNTPNLPDDHIRYSNSQEEIWVSDSNNLNTFPAANFSFNIMPETKVVFKQNMAYKDVYPSGFKSGCTNPSTNYMCNVQVNDPSLVKFQGSLYMYFTIFENYRWTDGTLGTPVGPSNLVPNLAQSVQEIGLAVSNDDGKNWAFVDKILTEHQTSTQGDVIWGPWAPSALVTNDNNVDLYFHDVYNMQYVAHLIGGVNISGIDRLNQHDNTYRVNLDVIKNGDFLEAVYNDSNFGITRTFFTSPSDFGVVCPETVVVSGSNPDVNNMWPTPHQVIDGNKVHLFYSIFDESKRLNIYHKSRLNESVNTVVYQDADQEPDGDVDYFDYQKIIELFGLSGQSGWIRADILKNGKVDIYDFNKLISDFSL